MHWYASKVNAPPYFAIPVLDGILKNFLFSTFDQFLRFLLVVVDQGVETLVLKDAGMKLLVVIGDCIGVTFIVFSLLDFLRGVNLIVISLIGLF